MAWKTASLPLLLALLLLPSEASASVETNLPASGAPSTYTNPIIGGDYADPSIIRVGSDYYLTHSSFKYAPGLLIWHSRDLIHWEPVTYALHRYDGDVWAPDLVHYKDRFYIYYYTGGDAGIPRGMKVISAPSIQGPWSDPVDLHLGHIDPGHVAANDGKRYLILSSGYLVELAPDGLSTKGEPRQVYEGWTYPDSWRTEGVNLEGPKMFYKDGYYHLIVAEGGTAGPATSHMVVHARSRNPWGPWENSPYNPIIHTASRAEQWWSRGHGSLIDTPSGQWWLVYHSYDKDFKNLGRQSILEPVEWTPDGWIRSEGTDPARPIPSPDLPLFQAKGFTFRDDFRSQAPAPFWRYWEGVDTTRFTCGDGSLKLAGFGDSPGTSRPMVLITGEHSFRIEADVEPGKGCEAGLILFYNPLSYAAVGCSEQGVRNGFNGKMRASYQFPGAKRYHLVLVFDHNEVDFMAGADGAEPKKLWGSRDVAGYNHNTFGGFISLRPGIFCCGNGSSLFHDFRLTPELPSDAEAEGNNLGSKKAGR